MDCSSLSQNCGGNFASGISVVPMFEVVISVTVRSVVPGCRLILMFESTKVKLSAPNCPSCAVSGVAVKSEPFCVMLQPVGAEVSMPVASEKKSLASVPCRKPKLRLWQSISLCV